MKNLSFARSIAAAALLSAAAAATLFSGGANAGISQSLANCSTNGRGAAIDCCEKAYNRYGGALMSNSGQSCNQLVKCYGRRCYVKYQVLKIDREGGNSDEKGNQRGGRGNAQK